MGQMPALGWNTREALYIIEVLIVGMDIALRPRGCIMGSLVVTYTTAVANSSEIVVTRRDS